MLCCLEIDFSCVISLAVLAYKGRHPSPDPVQPQFNLHKMLI
jgi:hypothetical protein